MAAPGGWKPSFRRTCRKWKQLGRECSDTAVIRRVGFDFTAYDNNERFPAKGLRRVPKRWAKQGLRLGRRTMLSPIKGANMPSGLCELITVMRTIRPVEETGPSAATRRAAIPLRTDQFPFGRQPLRKGMRRQRVHTIHRRPPSKTKPRRKLECPGAARAE